MVVQELAEGAVAGLLKEEGGHLTVSQAGIGEISIQLDDMSALSQPVQCLNLEYGMEDGREQRENVLIESIFWRVYALGVI